MGSGKMGLWRLALPVVPALRTIRTVAPTKPPAHSSRRHFLSFEAPPPFAFTTRSVSVLAVLTKSLPTVGEALFNLLPTSRAGQYTKELLHTCRPPLGLAFLGEHALSAHQWD